MENKTIIDWEYWELQIKVNGIVIDRPKGKAHPTYSHIIYPIDYGYIANTRGSDGEEVDIFIGSAENGLVGAIMTIDNFKNEKELKLLWNMSKEEVSIVYRFIRDSLKMEETIMLRKEFD